jgi:DNA-binding IclR family transcriptional regulator
MRYAGSGRPPKGEIGHVEAQVLGFLVLSAPSRVGSIAAALRIPRQQTSNVLAGLARRGLVRRADRAWSLSEAR